MANEQDIRDIRNYMLDITQKHGEIAGCIGRVEEQIKAINKRLEDGDKAFDAMSSKFESCRTQHAETNQCFDERLDAAEADLGFGEKRKVTLREKVENLESTVGGWKKLIAVVIGGVTIFSTVIVQVGEGYLDFLSISKLGGNHAGTSWKHRHHGRSLHRGNSDNSRGNQDEMVEAFGLQAG